MGGALAVLGHGFRDSFLMAWEVWWALVLGFAISALVQAWVPRERVERALGGWGARPVAVATGLGAVSSSCSYAAVAIARSLFEKGAAASSALAFQLASTNLVWELGLVLWVLIGWQFTLGEYLGSAVMIVVMALLLRLFVSRSAESEARARAGRASAGHGHDHRHQHHHGHHYHHGRHGGSPEAVSLRQRLLSVSSWSEVAQSFRGDWAMLWKEITVGFLLAGFLAQFGDGFYRSLFATHAPQPIHTLENVVVGPLIAVASFVCSLGNVPLAAVLWSGGISFAGALSFLFADLIVLPIVAFYRKTYGTSYALRITALMLVSMIVAALLVAGMFNVLGVLPASARPARTVLFGALRINYKLFLNMAALALFGAMLWLSSSRRGQGRAGAAHAREEAVPSRVD